MPVAVVFYGDSWKSLRKLSFIMCKGTAAQMCQVSGVAAYPIP